MQKRRKKLLITTIILLIILISALYYNYVVMPIVCTLATEEIRAEVINIVNYANSYLQSLSLFYDDYFKIHYDTNNKISAISANTGLINQINMILQKQVQDQLNQLRTKRITLPLGAFTGNSLLAVYGMEVPLHAETVCNCYTSVDSKFEGMGINQTRHRIYIIVVTDIKMIVPLVSENLRITTNIPIAETIIVGDVPEQYVNVPKENILNVIR